LQIAASRWIGFYFSFAWMFASKQEERDFGRIILYDGELV